MTMTTTDTPSLSTLTELGGTELIDAAIATLGAAGSKSAGKSLRGTAESKKARSPSPRDAEESEAEPNLSPAEEARPPKKNRRSTRSLIAFAR